MINIEKRRVEEIFDGFRGRSVLVLGDVMLDKYLRGKVSRISPEAPVPVVEMESETYHFGGAANAALNLKTLGLEPILIGLIGDDRNGEIFFELLKEQNLSVEGMIKTNDRPTTVKTRIIGDNQHIARVDSEKILYADGQINSRIISKIEKFCGFVDAVLIEDYNKGVLSKEVIQHTLNSAKERGIISAVDPKFVNFLEYKGATVFKPNLKEVSQALARPIDTDEEVILAGEELRHHLSAKCLLLTRGAQGLSLFEESGEITHAATKSRSVADVSGAGDTVISAMTAVLAAGGSFKEAAQIANHAAGIVCEEVGIIPVQADDLKSALYNETSGS